MINDITQPGAGVLAALCVEYINCHPDMCSGCADADSVPDILGRAVQPRHERAAGVPAHAPGRQPCAAGPCALSEALLRILVQLWRRGRNRWAADTRACPHIMPTASWTCVVMHEVTHSWTHSNPKQPFTPGSSADCLLLASRILLLCRWSCGVSAVNLGSVSCGCVCRQRRLYASNASRG